MNIHDKINMRALAAEFPVIANHNEFMACLFFGYFLTSFDLTLCLFY
jgi:hypothetical protein